MVIDGIIDTNNDLNCQFLKSVSENFLSGTQEIDKIVTEMLAKEWLEPIE